MIERLTPKYRFVCDRCGKEQFCYSEEIVRFKVLFICRKAIFEYDKIEGEVCQECYKDFLEIAHNFFDEANKERSENGKS